MYSIIFARGIAWFLGSLMIYSAPLVAQVKASPAVTRGGLPGDSLAVALTTITTDTGDMKLGHHDFTRYTTPRMCEAAAVMTLANLRANLAAIRAYDTLQVQPLHDTTPREVQHLAQTCSATFSVTNTPPREWAALFDLALLAGNDSVVQTVLAHRVAAVSASDSQMVLRLEALRLYLGGTVHRWMIPAAPARLGLAQALVATIDQTSDTAHGTSILPRMQAHMAVLQFAVQTHDDPLLRREAAQVAAIAHLGVAATGTYIAQMQLHKAAYEALMQMAVLRFPDSIRAVAEHARQDLQHFPSTADICIRRGIGGWDPGCRTASLDTIVAELQHWRFVGNDQQSAPVTQTDFWFPHPPLGARPVVPVPGKVTLLVHFQDVCLHDHDAILFWPDCTNVFDQVRNLATRYGPDGLAVIVVAWDSPSILLSGLETPAEGANRIRWYYQDHERLPATVSVDTAVTPLKPLLGHLSSFFHHADGYFEEIVVLGTHGERLYDLELYPNGNDFTTVDQVIRIALQQR